MDKSTERGGAGTERTGEASSEIREQSERPPYPDIPVEEGQSEHGLAQYPAPVMAHGQVEQRAALPRYLPQEQVTEGRKRPNWNCLMYHCAAICRPASNY